MTTMYLKERRLQRWVLNLADIVEAVRIGTMNASMHNKVLRGSEPTLLSIKKRIPRLWRNMKHYTLNLNLTVMENNRMIKLIKLRKQ